MEKLILTDRSRIIARQECPRMGYLNYEWEGTGLQRSEGALPLINGIAIHDAHAELFTGAKVDTVLAKVMSDYKTLLEEKGVWNEAKDVYTEQAYLVEGMIRTWAHYRLPRIMDEFELATFTDGTPFIEKEFVHEIGNGVKAMLRMDAVLRRRSTKEFVIWDFKSLSYPSDNWYRQFEHCAQTYLYTDALAGFTGELVEGMEYEGLIKGMRKTETAKSSKWYGKRIQHSPYCYGYGLSTDGVTLYQTAYTAKKGYRKVAPWDEGLTPKEWWENVLLPEHHDNGLFNDLFCIVPPIKPVDWEVERWKRQATFAEYLNAEYLKEIHEARVNGQETEAKRLMEIYFPTNEGRCFKYGVDNACQFIDLCFATVENPLECGFEVRVPHHDTEKAA